MAWTMVCVQSHQRSLRSEWSDHSLYARLMQASLRASHIQTVIPDISFFHIGSFLVQKGENGIRNKQAGSAMCVRTLCFDTSHPHS